MVDKNKKYRRPILTLFIFFFAVLASVIACFAFAVLVVNLNQGTDLEKVFSTMFGLPLFVIGSLVALILFGIAQVIDYLGRTAHATEVAAELAKDNEALLRQLVTSPVAAPARPSGSPEESFRPPQ